MLYLCATFLQQGCILLQVLAGSHVKFCQVLITALNTNNRAKKLVFVRFLGWFRVRLSTTFSTHFKHRTPL
ncbi:hypothetical protein OENI_1350002 [Oenococcus oeni]|nr:hypothetical protein OENI_1350002 [Oenococcus oeni]